MPDPADAVECTVALTPDDVGRMTFRSRRTRIVAVVMVAFVGYILWFSLAMPGAWSDPVQVGLDALVLLSVAFFFVAPFVLPRFGRRRESLEPTAYRIDAEGVHSRTPRAKLDHEWARFTRVTETGRAFTFWITERHAFLVPFRSLAPGDVERVRALVQEGRRPKA